MATKGRIPIPKTQKEISNSTIIPYEKLERGNPNSTGGINRSEQISLKGDTPKPFGLGIKDIDEAIAYYFNNVIKPSVIQNGQRMGALKDGRMPNVMGTTEMIKAKLWLLLLFLKEIIFKIII